IFCPKRMIVFSDPLIYRIPLVWLGLTFNMDSFGHVHPDSLGALDTETNRIRTRQVRVMREKNSFSACTVQHGLRYVTIFIVYTGVWMTRSLLFYIAG